MRNLLFSIHITKLEIELILLMFAKTTMMLNWRTHVESNPHTMYGKPVILNTRIPVDLLLEKLSEGETVEGLLEAYPKLTKEDIYACLSFAAEAIKNEIVYSIAS